MCGNVDTTHNTVLYQQYALALDLYADGLRAEQARRYMSMSMSMSMSMLVLPPFS